MIRLSEAKKGKYTIHEIPTGYTAHMRCTSRGILPNESIEVLQNHSYHRPILVKIKNTEWAIGYGLAMKILLNEKSI